MQSAKDIIRLCLDIPGNVLEGLERKYKTAISKNTYVWKNKI